MVISYQNKRYIEDPHQKWADEGLPPSPTYTCNEYCQHFIRCDIPHHEDIGWCKLIKEFVRENEGDCE